MTYLVDRKAVQTNDKSELHFLHTRARQKKHNGDYGKY